jgi:PAS domain S-box-containing protein
MGQYRLFGRYRQLQSYVGWTADDEGRVLLVAPLLRPHLPSLVDDFYAEIQRHPEVRSVITGGAEQIERLKGSLLGWVNDLLSGRYDEDYVGRRWRVGWRHVEIGLDQLYTNAALSRLRAGMLRALGEEWPGDASGLLEASLSLTKLLDLDLAIIEDAYVAGYADLQGAIAALRQGASDYNLKPLNADALQASLARIADHHRLSLAKERSEAALRQLVEAADCLIVIIRPDRSILYFNPFAERVTGYAVEEILGRTNDPVVHPGEKNRNSIGESIDRVLGGEQVGGYEKPLICRDGSRRWIVWNARRLDDFEGGPAILGVGQDITELKCAQDRALQAERLAAIGQMVAGLAHESRNALQRSQACLEMLALADKDRPRSLDLIARIGRAQDDVHRLFEDVRGYAAPIRLDRRPTSLIEVWRGAWADLAPQRRGRDSRIRESSGGVDPRSNVDPFRLGQVFRNLFENALAAGADPVEISIGCEPAEVEGRPGHRVVVRDNGPGLDAEQSANLFEPFYTTKTKGTGLGLAIARRIVEAHGGRIEAANAEGSGAEILIAIPRGEI